MLSETSTKSTEDAPSSKDKPKRKAREFHYAPNNKHIIEVLKLTDATNEQLANVFGVSTSSVRDWVSGRSKCPKWTLVAAEGIRRRYSKKGECLLLMRVPKDKRETVETIVASLGGSLKALEF